MKHRVWYRLLTAFLCVCLLVGAVPLQAMAAVSATVGNTTAENQAILDKLQALTGSDQEAAAVLQAMQDLGLVDEDGSLLQTSTVTLDGKEMTLVQVREYLETCSQEDLEKTVDVDGTQITLENLATMIAIEDEIERIRQTYFSEETPELTAEQQAALQSLASQLETSGITLQNQAAANGGYAFASGVDHTARVTMSVDSSSVDSSTVNNAAGTVTATFTLSKAIDKDVTFTVRTLDGSAKAGTNYTAVNTRVTIAVGSTTASVEVQISEEGTSWTDGMWCYSSSSDKTADKIFYIQATGIQNALFADGASGARSLTQSVRIQSERSFGYVASDFQNITPSSSPGNGILYNSSGPNWKSTSEMFTDQPHCAYFLRNCATQVAMNWGNSGDESYPYLNVNLSGGGGDGFWPKTVYYNTFKTSTTNKKEAFATELYNGIKMGDVVKVYSHIGYDLSGAGNPTNLESWTNIVKDLKLLGSSTVTTPLSGQLTYDLPMGSITERKTTRAQLASGGLQFGANVRMRFFCTIDSTNITSNNFSYMNSAKVSISLSDNMAPAVDDISVAIPTGGFTAGDMVPVVVTFDGPVKVAGNETLVINNKTCKIEERVGTITKTVTFLYEMQAAESKDLTIGTISAFTDLAGNISDATLPKNENEEKWVISNVCDGSIPHWAAIGSLSTDASVSSDDPSYAAYAPGVTTGIFKVALNNSNENVVSWLTQDGATNSKDTLAGYEEYARSLVLGASLDGGKTLIPLYIKSDGSELVGVLKFPLALEEDENYFVELYELTNGELPENPAPMFGFCTGFTVQKAAFLGENGVTINTPDNWPAEGERFFADDSLTLSFTVNNKDATWTDTSKVTTIENGKIVVDAQEKPEDFDFAWSSNNPSVATIDKEGNITILTNGMVSFTLTAVNGNVDLTGENGESSKSWYTYKTDEIQVGVGNAPFLRVPESLRTTIVRDGQDATVLWSSNLTEKNRDAALVAGKSEDEADKVKTHFDVAVYTEDNWNAADNTPKAAASYTTSVESTMEIVRSSVSIPSSVITYNAGKSYYVLITSGEYSAWAKIEVQSAPAEITLQRPESLYITDTTKTLPLRWALKNFNGEGKQFKLTVTNNSKTDSKLITSDKTADNGGSYSMTIDSVTNGYRDVYTVEVAAKNASDSTWSYDSFVLYVYDADALNQIYVGEAAPDTLTLTNEDKDYIKAVQSSNSQESQKAVWDTGRDISLTADVSMNPNKPWLEVPDQFTWNAEDTDSNENAQTHATINYQQGALYEDITRYSRTSYGPLSEFKLSGLSDGTTTVTATHVNTQTAADLAVTVKTLKDKLFLFQASPAVETKIKYTNGDGEEKTVTSMADGRAAIYEESGIKGDVYLESKEGDTKYFGTIYKEDLVSSEQDSTQLQLYPVNYMTLRKAAQVPLYFKNPDGTPFTGRIKVHGGVYLNDKYASEAFLDTDEGSGHSGVEGYEVSLDENGSHTFVFDMTQFSTEGRDVSDDPVSPEDNVQFVFQIEPTQGDTTYYPVLVRINSNVNEYDAIAAGDRIITLQETEALATGEVRPFASVQTLYYGENKYGYSSDVLGQKGKLGPSDTYDNVELETLTLWWGASDTASGYSMHFEDEYRRTPGNQTCQAMDYPFTTIPITVQSFKLNSNTMNGWLSTHDSVRMDMVYTDGDGQQIRREDPAFRIINMIGTEDLTTSEEFKTLLRNTASKGSMANGAGKVDVANALVSTGIALSTSFGLDVGVLSMKVVPTSDPTVFRGFFMMGLNNMLNDNVTGIDPDTSRGGDLDSVPGYEDLQKLKSMGLQGYCTDAVNRLENAKKLLSHHAQTERKDNNISYLLQGGFETEIYFDYDTSSWKMVVITGQLNAGGGFGQTWCFNSWCGPVPVTAVLGYGIALSAQFSAAVDRTQMMNDYLTHIQLNAFIRAFGGVGFDYAVLAMKVGLYGQLSFEGAIRILNAIEQSAPQIGYSLDFDGEVGIEFLIRFLFISYERVLWSKKFTIVDEIGGEWEAIDQYWESVKNGKSGNKYGIIQPPESRARSVQQAELLAYNATTGTALYGSPSTATLESRDYLENPRTFGGSLPTLRSRISALFNASANSSSQTNLVENFYPNGEPMVTEDGGILAFLYDGGSKDLSDTRASYVDNWYGSDFQKNAIQEFPEPAADAGDGTQALANAESAGGGDNQLRIAGDSKNAIAAWTRVTETLTKEPGSDVTADEQLQMMNSTEIFASVKTASEWKTTRLTTNGSADMAPAVATNGKKALVAWRSVAASDSSEVTTFDSNDTILYRIYDDETGKWSEIYTLYNGTSGAVKGIEAQMTDSGAMAVAYTIEKGSSSSTTEIETDASGNTSITSNLQTIFALIQPNGENGYQVAKNVQVTDDDDVNENPQLTTVKFPDNSEGFILGWYSIHDEDGAQKNDIRLAAFTKDGTLRGDIPDSLSDINQKTGSTITSNFRFVKGAGSLEELSILWSQPSLTVSESAQSGETDHLDASGNDVLMGVRFRVKDSKFDGFTAAIQLASMGEMQTIESFDAWLNSNKNTVQVVALSTKYLDGYETIEVDAPLGKEEYETTEIAVQRNQANLVKLTGTYSDTITAEVPLPDYEALLAGAAAVPMQTTVTNLGTRPITELVFTVGEGKDTVQMAADAINLLPGESINLTLDYTWQKTATGEILCPKYTVSADFEGGATYELEGQEINLNVPDLRVSQFETVKQEEGLRTIQFSLFNQSPAQLEESNRRVMVGLFSDPECTKPISKEYVSFGDARNYTEERTYTTTHTDSSGNEKQESVTTTLLEVTDKKGVDEGSYTGQVTLNLKEYAKANKDNNFLGEDNEIREGGISVYLKAWVEDSADGKHEIGELYSDNNIESAVFQSLIELTGENFTMNAKISNPADGGTQVTAVIQNNSLQRVSADANQVLYLNLLDANGTLLETQQVPLTADSSRLRTGEWGPESTKTGAASFEKTGAQVTYFFGQKKENGDASLSNIVLDGIPLKFDSDTKSYQVQADRNLDQTAITLVGAAADAAITVNGKEYEKEENRTIALGDGTTTVTIAVASGEDTQTYTIQITRPKDSGNPDDGTVTRPTYQPVISGAEHGSVSVSPARPHQGDTVTITTTPDEGYQVGSVTVVDRNGNAVSMKDVGNGKYTFTQPNGKVTVTVSFVPEGWPFVDVAEKDWFYEAVKYVYKNDLMVGTSATTFRPGSKLTRAEMVQMLYNLEGVPAVTGEPGFTDTAGHWALAAITWAEQKGVVDGYGDGTFLPNKTVSRQEFAQMLYNYAKFKGYDVTASVDLSQYPDAEEVGGWAKPAVQWANAKGLIMGHADTGAIDPKGTATRAQAATILMRFDQNIVKR